jgi:hypothetical protein
MSWLILACTQGGNVIELNLMANVVRETVDHVRPRQCHCFFLRTYRITVTAQCYLILLVLTWH